MLSISPSSTPSPSPQKAEGCPPLRAALSTFILQPVLKQRIVPNQVRDLAFGLVGPHDVHRDSLLQLVQVPLEDILSPWNVNCTMQLGAS